MYHVITKDGAVESYAHPTVSTVTGGVRKVWQVIDDEDTVLKEYQTAAIAATVDCQHTEERCVCVETVLAQLTPVARESDGAVARRKLRSVATEEE